MQWILQDSNAPHAFINDWDKWGEDEEIFHNSSMYVNNAFPVTTAVCGEIYRNYHEVNHTTDRKYNAFHLCVYTGPFIILNLNLQKIAFYNLLILVIPTYI